MKKIRIGNDIAIRWKITINGESKPLEGMSLRLTLSNDFTGVFEIPFTIEDNFVNSKYHGVDQVETGEYTLTLWVNYGEHDQAVVDECDAFKLVPCTCASDDLESDIADEVLNLESEMAIGIKGDPGKDGEDGAPGKDGKDGLSGNINYPRFYVDKATMRLKMVASQESDKDRFHLVNGRLYVII